MQEFYRVASDFLILTRYCCIHNSIAKLEIEISNIMASSTRSLLRVSASQRFSSRTITAAPRQFICASCQQNIITRQNSSLAGHRNRQVITISHRRAASTTSTPTSNSNTRESILPQTHYDYFPLTLGASAIPPSGPFVIDLRALKREFLQLQQKAHPDLQPASQKRRAEGLSARINEAYKTLQNPLHRAQYLLSLRGIDVAEDETAKVEDPELLMEVLETRELIEEAEEEGDLEELKTKNDGRIGASEKVLEGTFASDDLVAAKEEAVKLRYWINIKESIDAWEKGKPVVLVH